jgi:hypothetical protein
MYTRGYIHTYINAFGFRTWMSVIASNVHIPAQCAELSRRCTTNQNSSVRVLYIHTHIHILTHTHEYSLGFGRSSWQMLPPWSYTSQHSMRSAHGSAQRDPQRQIIA